MDDILTLPVAIRRALFWIVWSLLRVEGEALGYQMGAAEVNNDLINDLNVMMRVSLCCPQDVPERAFRILRWVEERSMSDWM